MISTILFDLDGTLLPMDQNDFTRSYFKSLSGKMLPYGYEPAALEKGIWTGTGAMVMNDGGCANEEAFWKCFAKIFGEDALTHKDIFEDFYRNEFNEARKICGFNPAAAETVRRLKGLGYRVALATNPIFPAVATENRIRWAGLEPTDFELYTTYENCRYCKPNLMYYKDILEMLGVSPSSCLMAGNDVGEDMVAGKLGMKVFLITDCLINSSGEDISAYPHGGFAELLEHIATL